MDNHGKPLKTFAAAGLLLAPIQGFGAEPPLRVCLLVRADRTAQAGPFLLLREQPGSRVYLGAVCDAGGRVQELVEVWVQDVDFRDLTFANQQERLTNGAFDQRWSVEHQLSLANLPESVILTGMETANPGPLLIKTAVPAGSVFAQVEPLPWRICRDDALLESFGMPQYSTSPFRYLHNPSAPEPRTFVTVTPEAPTNAHVQTAERLKTDPAAELFNAHAGFIQVTRFTPLGLEDYLQILEGRPWEGLGAGVGRLFQDGLYAELQSWSAKPRGLPFLLHGTGTTSDRLNELFFLKLAILLSMFKEVRAYVKASQLPLLNLSPTSFNVALPDLGEQLPGFWAAKTTLVKPGQAYPLQIKSTEQRYFIRLGRIEPSPFLPEGLGAHSFGRGSVRLRNVQPEGDGTVLQGTLVAEDYLGLDPHDLLWFRLPVGEERLDFYAHVYTDEAVGPREARFRTVPAKLPEAAVTLLRSTAAFARSPYEIWPLLSSPCDLHSLGILAIRALLANSKTNLPTLVDDVLGLARRMGKDPAPEEKIVPRLKEVLAEEKKLLELIGPQAWLELDWTPDQARAQVHAELWLESIAWLLRLFPGAGSQSYCKDFGDVSALALETVFDRPIQDLERLVLRLRSVLLPTTAANAEIAAVISQELAKLSGS